MQALREKVQQYAEHDESVLFSGEPGTGRGAFARYLHALSRRADEPLISVTAASLTEGSAEEQLLGVSRMAKSMPGLSTGLPTARWLSTNSLILMRRHRRCCWPLLEDRHIDASVAVELVKLQARILATAGTDYEARVEAGLLRRGLVSHLSVLSLGYRRFGSTRKMFQSCSPTTSTSWSMPKG